jgi:hypothetical protein
MIALDTNILVRYVTQDDVVQSAKATKLIEALTSAKPAFVPMIVVVELVWVLESCYQANRKAISDTLGMLLQSEELRLERGDVVGQALRLFRAEKNTDFVDCLIERVAHAAGCEHMVTFDREASKLAGTRLLA